MTTRTKSNRLIATPLGLSPTTQQNLNKVESSPNAAWVAQLEAKIVSAVKDSTRESGERILLLIGELTAELTNLKQSVKSLEERVEKVKIDRAELEKLRNEVRTLKTEVCANESLSVEVRSLRDQLDRCERAEIAADACIHGIPAQNEENLTCMLNNICSSLNTTTPRVKSIFRARKSSNSKTDAPIIIKFISPKEKGAFLKSIALFNRNNDKLCLRHAGFDSNMPIYANECLTKASHALLKTALRLKKHKQIFSVFTRRGQIFIKRSLSDTPVCVPTMQTLRKLVGTDEEITLFRSDA